MREFGQLIDAIQRLEKTICWKFFGGICVLTLQIAFKISLEIFSTGQFNSIHDLSLTGFLNGGLASWNRPSNWHQKIDVEVETRN